MIQRQLKIRIKHKQSIILEEWLFILRAVWNFAIRKIELDAKDGIYYTKKEFQNLFMVIDFIFRLILYREFYVRHLMRGADVSKNCQKSQI